MRIENTEVNAPDLSRIAAPSVIMPPASLVSVGTAAAVWFGANWDLCQNFDLPVPGTFRYALLFVGTQSGNIQISVVKFTGTGDTPNYHRVATTGIIACPAASGSTPSRIDMGAFDLGPGRYGLSLWCDNTTAQFCHASNTAGVRTARQAHHLVSSTATGVPLIGAPAQITNRYLTGIALEGDI